MLSAGECAAQWVIFVHLSDRNINLYVLFGDRFQGLEEYTLFLTQYFYTYSNKIVWNSDSTLWEKHSLLWNLGNKLK